MRRVGSFVWWLMLLAACSQSNARRPDDSPALVTGSGTGSAGSQPSGPTPTVTFTTAAGDVVVHAEVVATPAKIMKGLMYREHLPPDDGMLFMMGEDAVHNFYMRNTLIPLDMIFIDRDLVVAGIVENTVPRSEQNRNVGKPSRYVLEVNAGWSRKHQVAAGTKVRFDNVQP